MKRIDRKRGFTLIELLVVISIIALLLAILMPALNKVKVQAGTTICLTRMKEVMKAILLYETSQGSLPTNEEVFTPVYIDRRYNELIAPYVGRERKENSSTNLNTSSGFKLFRCTSQDYITKLLLENPGLSSIPSPKTGWPLNGLGTAQGIYGYNPYFRRENSLYRHSTQILHTSELPILADLSAESPGYMYVQSRDGVAGARLNERYPHPSAYDYGWKRSSSRNYNNCHAYGPAPNHKSDKINYAFADGHVQQMPNLWPWHDKTDLISFRSHYFHPRREK